MFIENFARIFHYLLSPIQKTQQRGVEGINIKISIQRTYLSYGKKGSKEPQDELDSNEE